MEDDNLGTLKAKVIEMLQKAAEPALQDCSFKFMSKSVQYNPESLFQPSENHNLG